MHVRSKFDGGKQINRSQKGSWQSRCAGAALRMNEGSSWGPMCWKKVTGMQPSRTFETVAASRSKKVAKDRKRSDNSLQSRLDYSRHDGGPNALDVSPDLPATDLHDLMTSYYLAHVKVNESEATKITINTTGQGDDDNTKIIWHEERRKRITASNVGKIAKRRATTKVSSTVQLLLNAKFQGNSATNWEPFVRKIATENT